MTLPDFFNEEQHAVFRRLLGGLYNVPSDQRLSLAFQAFELQQQSWNIATQIVSEFLSSMKILTDFGGSFTIRDYDNTHGEETVSDIRPGAALYGYKGDVLKLTAQEAEEYLINIPPIKRNKSTVTSPWRRLMQVESSV
jgi:hypothetical protein